MKAICFFIVAATAAFSSLASAEEIVTGDATLSFVVPTQSLAGTLYGIESIDVTPQTFDKQLKTDLVAGRRTVWYSCPTTPRSTLTYDFSAGGKYELVCSPGQGAEIHRVDEC